MNPEYFNGIVKFRNFEYHIKLEDDARPIGHPVIKIVIALRCTLGRELKNMVA